MSTTIRWSFQGVSANQEEVKQESKIKYAQKYWGTGERKPDDESIRPFTINVSQDILDDLQTRLGQVRFPQELPEDCPSWFFGFETDYMRELLEHWRTNYDWRKYEQKLNEFPHFKTEIDGIDLHFIHAKSSRADARPLIITHGWPGSVWEFENLIPLLTEPDDPSKQAFHVVTPSIPGYGWSSVPKKVGYNAVQAAVTFSKLMGRLGYSTYLAQGGDWGSLVTNALPLVDPGGCEGIHLQLLITAPGKTDDLSKEEKTKLKERQFGYEETGYSHELSTKPQTLSFGISDSPAGVAAWIIEKFHKWSDIREGLEVAYSKDELLTNVMIYWVTNTISSSVRLYKETNVWDTGNMNPEVLQALGVPVDVPMGHADFPYQISCSAWIIGGSSDLIIFFSYTSFGLIMQPPSRNSSLSCASRTLAIWFMFVLRFWLFAVNIVVSCEL